MADIVELPGNRLSTKRVTVKKASDPAELRAFGDDYHALADYLEGVQPVDPAQVAAIEEVVVAAADPPAETPRQAAVRLFHGGLRHQRVQG